MMTLTHQYRQNVSVLLVLSMLFSVWFVSAPTIAHASLWDTVKGVTKKVVVTGGSLATGFMGGVLGAALGGGPLGMAVGAAGGYIVGKKALEWTTKSSTNLVTVLGAAAGGALCIGMGLPMLAVGVIGGGVIGMLAAKAFKKMFGKKDIMVEKGSIDPAAAAIESSAVGDFISGMNNQTAAVTAAPVAPKPVVATPAVSSNTIKDSQSAYNKYLAAYKGYMTATDKGDSKLAQASYVEYKKYLNMYNEFVKAGK